MTKRPIKITVRLSQAEAARLNALASECGSKKNHSSAISSWAWK